MFINCRHCNALVATHPATDQAPERCPHCAGSLGAAAGGVGNAVPDGPMPQQPSENADARTLHDAEAAWHRAADLLSVPAPATAATASPIAAARPTPAVPPTLPLQHAVGAGTAAAAPQTDDAAPSIDPAMPDTNDAGTDTDATPVSAEQSAFEAEPAPESAAAPADGGSIVTAVRDGQHPSFVAARAVVARHAARHRWWMPATLAVLSLLLALQILLADRGRLAMDAGWRPLLSSLCGALGCALPPWREPAAFNLLARDVRPDPARPGVLRASATFRNDARWAQAWPEVVLTLSDVDGRAIGRRAFTPHEYLGAAPAQETLASEQSAMIRLEIMEPAANVVAFSFQFQ